MEIMNRIPKRAEGVNVIPLTGGLGNQLFQLAFGIWGEKTQSVGFILDSHLGNPRKTEGIASLMNLEMDAIDLASSTFDSRSNKFFSKTFGWNLTSGLQTSRRNPIVAYLGRLSSRYLYFFRYGRVLQVKVANDLGFDQGFRATKNSLSLGYFQTFKYARESEVFRSLISLKPKKFSMDYETHLKTIRQTEPFLIHVRLTDYLQEQKFGIPNLAYYENSVKKLEQDGKKKPIWVFSDDISVAEIYFKGRFSEHELFFFDDTKLPDIEVWHLMRKFSGYVISNSTFSWWAAFLRDDLEAKVCCPTPWFQGMEDPKFLLPNDWIRISSI